MLLEFLAFEFLRFEKGCPVAIFERSPRRFIGQPDVLGITKDGYLLEIEIKRSLSDFRADAKKPHRWLRSNGGERYESQRYPKQFWYLTTPELAKRIESEIPKWAGLLRGPGRNERQQLYSVTPAPSHRESSRLTAREKVELGHCMANQIYSDWKRIMAFRSRWEQDFYLPSYDYENFNPDI